MNAQGKTEPYLIWYILIFKQLYWPKYMAVVVTKIIQVLLIL